MLFYDKKYMQTTLNKYEPADRASAAKRLNSSFADPRNVIQKLNDPKASRLHCMSASLHFGLPLAGARRCFSMPRLALLVLVVPVSGPNETRTEKSNHRARRNAFGTESHYFCRNVCHLIHPQSSPPPNTNTTVRPAATPAERVHY